MERVVSCRCSLVERTTRKHDRQQGRTLLLWKACSLIRDLAAPKGSGNLARGGDGFRWTPLEKSPSCHGVPLLRKTCATFIRILLFLVLFLLLLLVCLPHATFFAWSTVYVSTLLSLPVVCLVAVLLWVERNMSYVSLPLLLLPLSRWKCLLVAFRCRRRRK